MNVLWEQVGKAHPLQFDVKGHRSLVQREPLQLGRSPPHLRGDSQKVCGPAQGSSVGSLQVAVAKHAISHGVKDVAHVLRHVPQLAFRQAVLLRLVVLGKQLRDESNCPFQFSTFPFVFFPQSRVALHHSPPQTSAAQSAPPCLRQHHRFPHTAEQIF